MSTRLWPTYPKASQPQPAQNHQSESLQGTALRRPLLWEQDVGLEGMRRKLRILSRLLPQNRSRESLTGDDSVAVGSLEKLAGDLFLGLPTLFIYQHLSGFDI